MGEISLFESEEFNFIRSKAKEYNVEVRIRPLDEGIRGYKIDGEIVLNEYCYAERRNWTFCHELGHIILGHSSEPSDDEEKEADCFAAEIMMPEVDFIPDSRGVDLIELKRIYPHASWEAIARRCLQFHELIITIFDEGKVTFRSGSGNINFPYVPLNEEISMMEDSYKGKKSFGKIFGSFSIEAYFIDESKDILRVILVTQIEKDYN
ncbi:MAG: ImmA/IrrE family metallo-endopeptidase [Candidatus Marinimicrobia bacterium]|nr:ImmA/IrrE family metallo-endopeptidase [Candidatus Neomarinimicrobiota bacterium]